MKTNESLFCGAPGILWEEGKDNALRELALLTPSRRAPPSPFRCHVCQPKACPSWVIIRCTREGEVCGPPCPGQIPGPASGSAARRVQAGTLKHRESWLLPSPCQRGSCQVTAHPWASVWHAYECLLCAWYGHLHQCFPDLSVHQNHLGAWSPPPWMCQSCRPGTQSRRVITGNILGWCQAPWNERTIPLSSLTQLFPISFW